MRVLTSMSWLWPGLPRLWAHGDWVALFWAAIFAVLLNSALVVTFIWPELVSPISRFSLWLALGAVWLTSIAWYAWRIRFETVSPEQLADREELFVQAQNQYLGADWYQAEVTLRRLLRTESQDVDSRLMLATLLRRTGRLDEARRELTRLEQQERSEKWQLEIEQEQKRIERLLAEGSAGVSLDDGETATGLNSGISEELTETSEAA